MPNDFCCPRCGTPLIQGYPRGTAQTSKLRSPIILFKSGRTEAKCKHCKAMVEIPVKLEKADAGLREVNAVLCLDLEQLENNLRTKRS